MNVKSTFTLIHKHTVQSNIKKYRRFVIDAINNIIKANGVSNQLQRVVDGSGNTSIIVWGQTWDCVGVKAKLIQLLVIGFLTVR